MSVRFPTLASSTVDALNAALDASSFAREGERKSANEDDVEARSATCHCHSGTVVEWGQSPGPTADNVTPPAAGLLTSTTKTFAASAGCRGVILVARAIRLEMRGARLEEGCMFVFGMAAFKLSGLGRLRRKVALDPLLTRG